MSQPATPTTATPDVPPTFESQLDRKLSGDGGAPLQSDVASQASSTYGQSMSQVRVHTDSESAAMAESKGFQAFSYGGDVFGTPSALDTSTDHGKFVMNHELAHVAQTGGERTGGVHGKPQIGTATDSADALEADADRGAEAALAGGSYKVQSAPLAVRGFGATAKKKTDIVHENQTKEGAAAAGFNDADATMIYSGNWNRDMNQLLIPKIRAGHPALFTAMDLLHTLHFNFPIGGEPGAKPGGSPGKGAVQEFGSYDPVEHIDNPGGLTGADVNALGGNAEGSHNAGSDKAAYAEIEKRYQQQYDAMTGVAKATDKRDESGIANKDSESNVAFRVDESGIPVYMQTSRTQLIKHLQDGLDQAAIKDPAQKQTNYNRALRYAGESLHIMQDYYAHSNFCEIAMNILIDSKFTGDGKVAAEGQGGRNFIDALKLSAINPALADPKTAQQHLNTYVHKKQNGKTDGANMTVGSGKKKREVMATGTFTLEDTIHSLKEKMGIALSALNPFEKGASEKGKRLMVWLESNPTYFSFKPTESAQYIGEKMAFVDGAVKKLGGATNTMLAGHGKVAALAEQGWGHVKSGWHSLWGDDKQAAKDVKDGDAAAARTEAESKARQEAVDKFCTEWTKTAAALQNGSLVSLYEFVTGPGAGPKLSSLAKMIPIVGDEAAKLVEEAVKSIKEWLRQKLEAAFHSCMLQLTAEINSALAQYLGSSEVHDKTGAQGMTQPTHTDIAKDFSDDQNGTEDRFSIIEEVGEFFHRVGGAKNAGQRLMDKAKERFDAVMGKKQGVVEGLRGAANDLSSEINGPKEEEGGHKHQHRHAGAWLARLADGLAKQSSAAILSSYKPLLEQARTGKKVDVAPTQAVVMKYYAHPADCQGLWQPFFTDFLTGKTDGADDAKHLRIIKEELARRIALPPMQQSSNDQHTHGGTNRHGDHDDGDDSHGAGKAGKDWNDAHDDDHKKNPQDHKPHDDDHDHDHDHDHAH